MTDPGRPDWLRVNGRPVSSSPLPPYLGGKRRLLGHIARVLPPPLKARTLADPFLGGGSVSLWAKRRGYQVLCNDIADRSVIVGRALIANDRVKLTAADVSRLFVPAGDDSPGFIERVYGGEALPRWHATFLDGAFPVARSVPGAKGALLQLLLLRYVLWLRPGGNWGAKTIIRQMDAGEWESVNENYLRDHLVRRVESHPRDILEDLRVAVNRGVFSNGYENQCHKEDAIEFVRGAEADVIYLDPPYGGTLAYESSLKPLDSILAGEPVEATPSVFSGRRAMEALDELLEASRHIPHLVLSYGNATVTGQELGRLVERHRLDVRVEEIKYEHLASLARDDSRERNREILIAAGRGR